MLRQTGNQDGLLGQSILMKQWNIRDLTLGGLFTALIGGISFLLYGMIGTSGLRILVDSKVDHGKNRNQALTAVIFVTGLSGIKVNFGNVQLTGMVLACVVGMILSLIFYIFDKMKLTNDQ